MLPRDQKGAARSERGQYRKGGAANWGGQLFKLDAKLVRLFPYNPTSMLHRIAVDKKVEVVGDTERAPDPKTSARLRYVNHRAADGWEIRCNNDHCRLLARAARMPSDRYQRLRIVGIQNTHR